MKLTEIDLKILKSYDTLLDGLADYLGKVVRSFCTVWRIWTGLLLKS